MAKAYQKRYGSARGAWWVLATLQTKLQKFLSERRERVLEHADRTGAAGGVALTFSD